MSTKEKRETAKNAIKSQINCENYLQKAPKGNYICPFCGSGTGEHRTGALSFYRQTNTFTCHACGKSGDVIDLYMQTHEADYNTALRELSAEIGVDIGGSDETTTATSTPEPSKIAPNSPEKEKGTQATTNSTKTAEKGEKGQNNQNMDFSAYYGLCCECLQGYPQAVEYLKSRGISTKTARACGVGFDPGADPANAPGGVGQKFHPVPRLIIPTSKSHYVARRTDGIEEYDKLNPKGGKAGIFNANVLFEGNPGPVFVLEGAFDAMSVLELGQKAIALNSANNGKALFELLQEKQTECALIFCPDNDQEEEKRKKIRETFEGYAKKAHKMGLDAIVCTDLCGSFKDANEALQENPERLKESLEKAARNTAPKPDNTQYYLDALISAEMDKFKQEKKTGFSNLDKESGGLYAGLYVLAAISSLGKTTFALQMAEQLAASGEEVLFFTLEQSRLELVSKILSRRTVGKTAGGGLYFDNAVTSLQIRKGSINGHGETVANAARAHREEVGDRLSIIEGDFTTDFSFIRNKVKRYIEKNRALPVVFVDYLQIIEADETDEKKTHSIKEVVDKNIKNLKLLSKDYGLTIIVISSINRANYQTPIGFESLKESGNVEYSCDVLWGLQLECLNEDLFEKEGRAKEKRQRINEAKAETPRKIDLVCIKNRYGKPVYKCGFKYYPSCDLFVPIEKAAPTAESSNRTKSVKVI